LRGLRADSPPSPGPFLPKSRLLKKFAKKVMKQRIGENKASSKENFSKGDLKDQVKAVRS
jgi:hypothetical protein